VARRSALLVALLLAVLALLAPLAVVADSCPDCGPARDCCPALGCACCLAGSSVLTARARVDLGPASTAIVGDPPAHRRLSADPRDVFHVPKFLLA
jgi:hypothetical protein